MITRIYVDPGRLGRDNAAVAIDRGEGSVEWVREANMPEGARIVQDPLGMPVGGTRRSIHVWIETDRVES